MRLFAAAALLLGLTACGSDAEPADEPTTAELQQQVCVEVRKGIDAFNASDYAETVRHFAKAKKPAKVKAQIDPEPEADALLDAVEYYANLDPADYPEAARTSEHFARNKAITLGQCTDGTPLDQSDDDGVLT